MKTQDIVLVTTDFVPGKKIVNLVGLVRGNTIRANGSERTSWPD